MALGLVSTANAQSGYYIGAGAGVTIMKDPTTSFTFPAQKCIIGIDSRNCTLPESIGGPTALGKLGGAGDPSFKAKMDLGFGVDVSAGYSGLFIPEFRVEGEINYHSNGIDKVTSS